MQKGGYSIDTPWMLLQLPKILVVVLGTCIHIILVDSSSDKLTCYGTC